MSAQFQGMKPKACTARKTQKKPPDAKKERLNTVLFLPGPYIWPGLKRLLWLIAAVSRPLPNIFPALYPVSG